MYRIYIHPCSLVIPPSNQVKSPAFPVCCEHFSTARYGRHQGLCNSPISLTGRSPFSPEAGRTESLSQSHGLFRTEVLTEIWVPANRPTRPKVRVARFPGQIWVPSKGLDLEGKFCNIWGHLESLTHLKNIHESKWPPAISGVEPGVDL